MASTDMKRDTVHDIAIGNSHDRGRIGCCTFEDPRLVGQGMKFGDCIFVEGMFHLGWDCEETSWILQRQANRFHGRIR